MYRMLLAVDGTEHDDHAVRHVIQCARHLSDFSLMVVNVQLPPMAGEVSNLLSGEEVAAMHEERGRAALARALAQLAAAGVGAQSEVVIGRPVEAILAAAATWKADVLVLGSHRRGRLGELLLGSVAQKVLHHTEIPVTVVR